MDNSKTIALMKATLLSAVYPIGAIYMSTNSTNPQEIFGGKWEAFAQGRTIIGAGVSDKEFIAGATGGSSSHTLTINELPSHNHTQNPHTHNNSISIQPHSHATYVKVRTDIAGISNDYGSTGDHVCGQVNGSHKFVNWAKTDNAQVSASIVIDQKTATNNPEGKGYAHNNLQPYIVTYIWRRIG